MISIEIDTRDLEELERAAKAAKKSLPREVSIAVNKTAKQAQGQISREIRKELNAPKKAVDKSLSIPKKATKQKTGAVVRLAATKRIPLRDFGARQTRAGVSYRISKGDGRKTVHGAFQGPKPGAVFARFGGHVFKRRGRQRLPIQKLLGVSPWGVFTKRNLFKPVNLYTDQALRKQLERRIRLNVLRASKLQ